MTTTAIRAIPMTYRGTRFRSTLEADWAATFDSLGWISWSYEPEPVQIGNLSYLPDFYLYNQRLWCEAKGPHDERIDKPRAVQRALDLECDRAMSGDESAEWWLATGPSPLVVILRPPGPGDMACWEAASNEHDIHLAECVQCEHYYFVDMQGDWSCRYGCNRKDSDYYGTPFRDHWASGRFPFTRAPRPERKGGR